MREPTSIKNPLTIIAIFAGIAEISGTSVLPFISESHQSIFIWFIMGFPVLLVTLFFATLNLNHKVLYAPSDYRADESFLKAMSNARAAAKAEKYREELQLVDAIPDVIESDKVEIQQQKTESGLSYKEILKRSARGSYFLAEELVLNKLTAELKGQFRREIMVGSGKASYMFDGVVTDGANLTVIEVKYLKDERVNISIFKNTIEKFNNLYISLAEKERRGFMLILAIATDADVSKYENIERVISKIIQPYEVPIELRIFDLRVLEKELEAI